MLFAIGAVLSVMLFLFPQNFVFALGACAAWILAAAASGTALFFRLFLRKKQGEERRGEEEKDRFLSDVAHELKTPLAVIRGNAEILADGVVAAEEYPAYCQRILRETEAMSRLVGDLLDLSRLRTGKVRFDPRDVDLAYLASTLCENIAPVAEKKGVFVAFEPRCSLPVLWMDYDRIRQLAVIFLDNGIKHTPEGGTVTLFLDREGDTVILGVQDTGHGISPEDLPHVFDRFYKADPQRGGLESGSGIGLSLAVQIARLHGGRVDVVSEIGKGSCFTARLPLRECKETSES